MRTKAKTFFSVLSENLNCAQSVLKGFQKEFNISDRKVEE